MVRVLMRRAGRVCALANPMPAEAPVVEKMAVFIPISLPLESSKAPPELPGLMAASCKPYVPSCEVWRHGVVIRRDVHSYRLNHVGNRPARRRSHLTTETRDDADRERVVEAERVANGQSRLSDA